MDIKPQAHTEQQPGLRGHSWNPEGDLLKRYRVDIALPGGGWSGRASYSERPDAELDVLRRRLTDETETEYRIFDQFAWRE